MALPRIQNCVAVEKTSYTFLEVPLLWPIRIIPDKIIRRYNWDAQLIS